MILFVIFIQKFKLRIYLKRDFWAWLKLLILSIYKMTLVERSSFKLNHHVIKEGTNFINVALSSNNPRRLPNCVSAQFSLARLNIEINKILTILIRVLCKCVSFSKQN